MNTPSKFYDGNEYLQNASLQRAALALKSGSLPCSENPPREAKLKSLINSCGNLGGWVGPYMMGWLKTETGSFDTGYFLMALFMFIAALTVLTIQYRWNGERKTAQAESEHPLTLQQEA